MYLYLVILPFFSYSVLHNLLQAGFLKIIKNSSFCLTFLIAQFPAVLEIPCRNLLMFVSVHVDLHVTLQYKRTHPFICSDPSFLLG